MHPSRWGDPAAATDLPDAARGLIEMAFGIDERPANAEVTLPVPAIAPELLDGLRGLFGAEHVLTDDATRRVRTRGKSTPDLLRQRDRRPGRRSRRRGPPGRPTKRSPQ